MANQKLGIAMPICASTITPTSPALRWRAAAYTPAASASAVVIAIAISASGTVSCRRSHTSSLTGTP